MFDPTADIEPDFTVNNPFDPQRIACHSRREAHELGLTAELWTIYVHAEFALEMLQMLLMRLTPMLPVERPPSIDQMRWSN